MTVLAVFRSRSQTLRFASALRETGVPLQTVNTPSELGVGCGLSTKFDSRYLSSARSVLRHGGYSAFAGFFSPHTSCGRAGFVRL